MTLQEMKKRVLSLIEEINPESEYLTDDEDIKAKINYVIDTKNYELSRIKKIPATTTLEVKANDEIDLKDELTNFYQLNAVRNVNYDMFENIITFTESGIAKINYYKYPKKIDDTTNDDYKFETTDDVLRIMPYGVAADLLKSDVSSNYGQIYANAYKEALNMLDMKVSSGSVRIEGGYNG